MKLGVQIISFLSLINSIGAREISGLELLTYLMEPTRFYFDKQANFTDWCIYAPSNCFD